MFMFQIIFLLVAKSYVNLAYTDCQESNFEI